MRPFTYSRALSSAAATRAATADPHAQFIAGGTTLIDLMKLDVEQPAHLVDLNRLAEHEPALTAIELLPGGGLRVGALVPNSDLAWDANVKERFPMLSEALLAGASGQLRNMATLGGNLLQRTRCPYFRDVTTACNKREPGAGCSAIGGETRSHAVLGTSTSCIAASPSDMAVALAALAPTIRVRSARGDRSIPFADFHLLPGAHPERDTVLNHGELILGVDLPPLPFARRSLYLKVRDRTSYAFALVSAAVALDLEHGVVRDARVALGGVGTRPWRSFEAEGALIGRRADSATFTEAAERALDGASPQPGNGFKVPLAKRTLARALATAAALS